MATMVSTSVATASTSTQRLSRPSPARPRTIQELTQQAKKDIRWDPNLKAGYWMEQASKHRDVGLQLAKVDVENGFLELVKSAEIMMQLRLMPSFSSYTKPEDKKVIDDSLHKLFDKIDALKPQLVKRFRDWSDNSQGLSHSDQDRKREDDRRRHAESQVSRLELDKQQDQAGDAARSHREADTREARARSQLDSDTKDRDKTKEKPKFSKASDGLPAALQETQREREKRKQIRIDMERQSATYSGSSVATSNTNPQTVPTFEASRRSGASSSASVAAAAAAAAARRSDDDIVLVGERRRQSSKDPSPISAHIGPTLDTSPSFAHGSGSSGHGHSPNGPSGSDGPPSHTRPQQASASRHHSSRPVDERSVVVQGQRRTGYSHDSIQEEPRTINPVQVSRPHDDRERERRQHPPQLSRGDTLIVDPNPPAHHRSSSGQVTKYSSASGAAQTSSVSRHNSVSYPVEQSRGRMNSFTQQPQNAPQPLTAQRTMPVESSASRPPTQNYSSASLSATQASRPQALTSSHTMPVTNSISKASDASQSVTMPQRVQPERESRPYPETSKASHTVIASSIAKDTNPVHPSQKPTTSQPQSFSSTRASTMGDVTAKGTSTVAARRQSVDDRRDLSTINGSKTNASRPAPQPMTTSLTAMRMEQQQQQGRSVTLPATGGRVESGSNNSYFPERLRGEPESLDPTNRTDSQLTRPKGSKVMSSAGQYASQQAERQKQQKRDLREFDPRSTQRSDSLPTMNLDIQIPRSAGPSSALPTTSSNHSEYPFPNMTLRDGGDEQARGSYAHQNHFVAHQPRRESRADEYTSRDRGKGVDRDSISLQLRDHGGIQDTLLSDPEDNHPKRQAIDEEPTTSRAGSLAPPSHPPRPDSAATYDSTSSESYNGRPSTPRRQGNDFLPILPVQSPRRWAGDESSADEKGRKLPPLPRPVRNSNADREQQSLRLVPAPTTTTAPSRPDNLLTFHQVMNQHQQAQGFTPSLHSVIKPDGPVPPGLPGRPPLNSTLFSDVPAQYNEANLNPQNPYPRRPGRPSQMPVQMMDRRSQQEAERIRFVEPQDRIKPELRQVDVPSEVLKRFVAVSAANTELGRETLGLLMGKYKSNKYVVTTLLIPRQKGASDWCVMEDEETMLQFQERRFLVTLGWIHTHPTQSCFMSSCDLHSHAPYQKMLPEAFAIVCAPTKTPHYGIFRLTDPPGLQYILDCKVPEMFHQHEASYLYTDCDRAHVNLVDGLGLEICDIRNVIDVA